MLACLWVWRACNSTPASQACKPSKPSKQPRRLLVGQPTGFRGAPPRLLAYVLVRTRTYSTWPIGVPAVLGAASGRSKPAAPCVAPPACCQCHNGLILFVNDAPMAYPYARINPFHLVTRRVGFMFAGAARSCRVVSLRSCSPVAVLWLCHGKERICLL